jgi:hypothetical protein
MEKVENESGLVLSESYLNSIHMSSSSSFALLSLHIEKEEMMMM